MTSSRPHPSRHRDRERRRSLGLPVEGAYDGSEYSVAGVKIDTVVWATVLPSPSDALPTAQPLNTVSGTGFDLVVVPGATFDQIYSVITAPTVRETGAAQIVLHFIDDQAVPLSGISVSHLGEIVAYDAAGTWSDINGATGDQGFAVIANVQAGTKPAKQTFTFSTSSGSAGVELWVEADTVTITDVVLVAP